MAGKSKPAKRGRPPKAKPRRKLLEVRLDTEEKQAFKDAAELSGLGLSTWVRERLRQIARRELEEAGRKVPFLEGEKM
jgi:predicted HicB family RNase H-like nuclease